VDFDYSLDNGAPGYLQVAFAVSISLSIALNLYVAVCCTMLQQNGKVARSLAISSGTAGDFDAVIKGWYQEEGFARFRTRLVWMFTLSFLFFGASLAFYVLVKMHAKEVRVGGWVCCGIFGCFAAKMLASILWLNKMFLEEILRKSKPA